jgi:glycine betaine/proline transport system ATP-binding protein
MIAGQTKIMCQNVWKIFGPNPTQVLDMVADDTTKEKLLEETGHVIAVRDVSFEVRENQVFVIMGLSGSGKSTLVRCINRLIEPTRGTILIDGVDIAQTTGNDLKELRRHKLSMVFQNFGLLPHRSVLDNVAFGLEVRGEGKKKRQEKTLQTLEMVGLKGWEKSHIYELSGGMQQRVGLARALAIGSEILLMDEPFSALDPLIRRQMQDEFLNLHSLVKRTVVFITHDLIEALRKPADDYVSEFVKDVPRGKVILARSIMEEPPVKVHSDQDIEAVIKEMADKRAIVTFVVGNFGKLVGVITMKEAIAADRSGLRNVGEIARQEFPSTYLDSPLEESLHLVAEGNIPVAVVDEDQNLWGIITRQALIKAMQSEYSRNSNGE